MIKTRLLKYQQDICGFIKDKKYFGLFCDFGIGKSLCILNHINTHKFRYTLIVAPKFALLPENTWYTEIKKHTDFRIHSLIDDNKKNYNYSGTIPLIFLINYDSLCRVLSLLNNEDISFDFIVFDESTWIKNPKTIRTKVAHKIAKYIPNRALVTGFPVTENLRDIHSQIFALDFGKSLNTFWKFNLKYFYKWKFGWSPKKESEKKIIKKIKDFCITKRLSDCLDLPPIKRKYIPLEATEEQTKLFKSIKENFEIDYKGIKITMQYVLPTLMKLRQVCSGFIYKESNIVVDLKNTPKDQHLIEIVKQIIPSKMIIWCEFNYEIRKLIGLLHKQDCIGVLSSDNQNLIEAKIKHFRTDASILIANPHFLGASETFVEANYMIRYSYTESYAKHSNSEARIYRKGAEKHKKVVYVYPYIKGSIEEKIIKSLLRKKNLINLLKDYFEELQ